MCSNGQSTELLGEGTAKRKLVFLDLFESGGNWKRLRKYRVGTLNSFLLCDGGFVGFFLPCKLNWSFIPCSLSWSESPLISGRTWQGRGHDWFDLVSYGPHSPAYK